MAVKNPLGKMRKVASPYLVVNGGGWSWKILKLYKSPASSMNDPLARAFCNVVSPIVGPSGEYGDVYLSDIAVGVGISKLELMRMLEKAASDLAANDMVKS